MRTLPPGVIDRLNLLVEAGLFGSDVDEVVERLVCERLRELEVGGWFPLIPMVLDAPHAAQRSGGDGSTARRRRH